MKKKLSITFLFALLNNLNAQITTYKHNIMLQAGTGIPLKDYAELNGKSELPGVAFNLSYSHSVKSGISPVFNLAFSTNKVADKKLFDFLPYYGYSHPISIISGSWKSYSLMCGVQLSGMVGKFIIDVKGLTGLSVISSPNITYNYPIDTLTVKSVAGANIGFLTGITIRGFSKNITYGIGADYYFANLPKKVFENKMYTYGQVYTLPTYIMQLYPYAVIGLRF